MNIYMVYGCFYCLVAGSFMNKPPCTPPLQGALIMKTGPRIADGSLAASAVPVLVPGRSQRSLHTSSYNLSQLPV